MSRRYRLRRRLAPVCVVLALLLGAIGFQVVNSTTANAATNQFHGVNWANTDDNFVTGPIVPVGLSTSDSYATTFTKSTAILKGFQALGANTVRMAFNSATTSGTWWSSYVGALDAASALGMKVVIAPWLQNGTVSDTNAFFTMWDVVINKYGSNPNFYFDIMNEPYAFNATSLTNFAAAWLAHYPTLNRSHVIVPGLFSDQNLCAVGGDSRLAGTLLSIHVYSMFGDSHTTEADWVTDFENSLCGFSSRAVLTEFGAPMNTGVNYDGARDGTNDISYLYAMTDTVRSLGMGSILWVGFKQATQTTGPGPCENGSCAITSLNGTGTNLSLSVTNQSGLDRLQFGWGGGNLGAGGPAGPVHAVGAAKCMDVTGAAHTNGTLVEVWDCNGGTNQTWTHTTANQFTVYGGADCLDAFDAGTAPGTKVDIWPCNGGTNQQWTVNANGTITEAQTGLCLDVANQAISDGTDLDLWTCNGQSNQKWTVG